MAAKKSKMGGARPGAGRPATGRARTPNTITLPIELWEKIDQRVEARKSEGEKANRSVIVEELLTTKGKKL